MDPIGWPRCTDTMINKKDVQREVEIRLFLSITCLPNQAIVRQLHLVIIMFTISLFSTQ